MKSFSEKLKDILYNSIDYILMLGIIIGIVLIIGWRLDALFAKDALDVPNSQVNNGENQEAPAENPDDKVVDKTDEGQNNNEKPNDNDQNNDDSEATVGNSSPNETEPALPSEDFITINIPQGSFPSQIASILQANHIIEDSKEFVQKSQELGLDTKLQSGSFKIAKNASLNEIIRIIAKQN